MGKIGKTVRLEDNYQGITELAIAPSTPLVLIGGLVRRLKLTPHLCSHPMLDTFVFTSREASEKDPHIKGQEAYLFT